MKRYLRLFVIALAVFCACSCAKSFQDIKVTSCDIVSLSPRGLTSIDATVNIGVDNPTVQVTLTRMNAVLKMDGIPCLLVTADDVTLDAKSEKVYPLLLHGSLDSEFNPFQLLTLLQQPDLEPMTIDVSFRGKLRSGLGKDFEYTDIPLKELLGKI